MFGRYQKIADDTMRQLDDNSDLVIATEKLVKSTKYYEEGGLDFRINEKHNTNAGISVEMLTSNEAIEKYGLLYGDVCVLNFASAKRAGGGFLRGAVAQEETLARSSNLYPSLVEQYEFYKNPKAPYYTDKVIYSPEVSFFKNDEGYQIEPNICSVITCAAPNLNVDGWDLKTLETKFLERIEKVFQVAIMNNEENLILGAWGCGVFKNPPKMVSEKFEIMLNKYAKYFTRIVFAIPDERNFKIFRDNITC